MPSIELWNHQRDALDKLRATARRGLKRIVLQAPPGAGKTEIAVEIVKSARDKQHAIAFTVPFITLVDQTVKRFWERGIAAEDLGVMQAQHEMTREHAPIQVVSVQTLQKRPFPLADIVIVDECHVRYEVIEKWKLANPKIIFIGLSATPWAKGMADQWNELIVVTSINELIAEGVLSPFRTFCPPQRPNLEGIKITEGDYAVGELSAVMQEKRLVGDVVTTWLERAEQRPTLVFAVDRAHAAVITEQFKEVGVRAAYVDANTTREDRGELIRELERGDIKLIVSIGTMTTGVDIPCVQCISYVRPTKSPILFVQSLARGLRAFEGKTDCLIFDHSTTTSRLGLISDIGFDALRPGVKPGTKKKVVEEDVAMPRECVHCNYIVPPREVICPNCGNPAKRRTGIRYDDGELVEMTAEMKAKQAKKVADKEASEWTPEERRRFFAELIGYAEAKGYKPGWANLKFKAKFDVLWPAGPKPHPVWPPSPATVSFIKQQNMLWRMQQERTGG